MAIEIKKSHKGLFTKKAKEHGMSVQAYAKYVLANKDNQDLRTVKQANFANNFAQFGIDTPNNNQNYSNLGYSNAFDIGNMAAVLTTLIANKANDISGLKSENNQYIKSIQPKPVQNYNSNGLNNTPAYFETGGSVDRNTLSDWNNFIDYVDKKGYKGSTALDVRDKQVGQGLFDSYKKDNPNSSLTYDSVLPIQNVMQQYRNQAIDQFKTGKAKVTGDAGTNYEHFMEGLSQPDGWFGSKTSSWKFPEEYIKTYNSNNQLESTQDMGLAKMKNGGDVSKEKAKEILRDGTAQGHKLTAKQKRYFGWIAGGSKAKYGVDTGTPTINAENGEVFQSNDGQIYDINGEDRHENGGVDLNNVQRVLENTSTYRNDKSSKMLKLTPDMVAELGGMDEKPKTAMSHAQAAKFLTKKLTKQVDKFEDSLDKNTEVLKDAPDNLYAKNSLQFNTVNLSGLPTEGAIFDKLFAHQEMVKQANGIENGKKMQYGGHKYKFAGGGANFDDTTPYSGGKTKKGRTTPTGKDNAFQFNIDEYNRLWKYRAGLDANQYPDNQSFQKSTYAYLMDTNPQEIRNMWSNYGNTDYGLKNKIGEGYDFNNLTDEQLSNLSGAYSDNLLGARSLLPHFNPDSPTKVPHPDMQLPPIPDPTGNPEQVNAPNIPVKRTTVTKDNKFFEPLRWFDIAAPLLSYLDSARIPNKYNPVNLNEVRLKQLNPEQALQRGQQDFNAVLGQLPNTGAGNSNAANVFSQKYAMDNQVIGNYDNQNAQIKNQETLYNAGVRDKQSMADSQSRDIFEQKVLGSREAQRQQKLTSLDDLFTRVALNHKLNREGNLMMQLFPNFDQNAQYNGNQRYFATNSGGENTGNLDQQLLRLGVNPKDLTQAQKLQYIRMQMPKKK